MSALRESVVADLERSAHAHVAGAGKGWICLAPGTKETDLLLLHELSHIIVGQCTGAHTRRWKAAFRRLGEEHSEAMAQLVEHEIWDDYSDVRRTG